MKRLFIRWMRELTECLPVCIWLAIGALVFGAMSALVIQSIKLVAPQWLVNTPFAGEILAEGAPTGAIIVFLVICFILALAMLLLPTMRRYAFLVAATLLSSPIIDPARGLRAALLGALWNVIHFMLGAILCAVSLYVLPVGFGALAQVMGLEQSLQAVSIQVNQTIAFLMSVGFFAFIISLPFVANRLARWLRLLARHLMVGEAVEFNLARTHTARIRISKSDKKNEISGFSQSVCLSSREHEIIVLVAEGLKNREIAERLFVTPETVKSHVSSILAKLDAENRTQAVSKALQIGLLEIETKE